MIARLGVLLNTVIRSIITFLGRFVRQPPPQPPSEDTSLSFFVTGDVILFHTSPVEKQPDIRAEMFDAQAELPKPDSEVPDSQAQSAASDAIISDIRAQFGIVFDTPYFEGKEYIRNRWNDDSNIYWTVTTVAIGNTNSSIVKFKAVDDMRGGHYVGAGLEVPENLDTLHVVNHLQQRLESNKGNVQSASLNWYSGGSQPRPIGTGGPEGGPIPVLPPVRPYYKPEISNLTQHVSAAALTRDVKIFVLDTAPPAWKFVSASSQFPNHPIINSFFKGTRNNIIFNVVLNQQNLPIRLSGSGCLTVIYNQLAHSISAGALMDFLKLCKIEGHDYSMYDHGSFVSGIIDSTIQRAYSNNSSMGSMQYDIELVEVLGEYGVGTLESIMWGLLYAWAQIVTNPRKSYVINCSFTLTTPRLDIPNTEQAAVKNRFLAALGAIPGLNVNNLVSLDNLKVICNGISQSVRISNESAVALVAAAGNESQPGQPRVKAASPADFGSVIGVAAIDDLNTPAPYSNIADDPAGIGFAIFGGKINTQRQTISPNLNPIAPATSVKDAIAGIYMGTFPASQANTTGWAWWSGTSFAAPQVAAALAIKLASNQSVRQAQDSLRNISRSPHTTADEWRLDVDIHS